MMHFLTGIQLEFRVGLPQYLSALCKNGLVHFLPAHIRPDIPHQRLLLTLRQEQPRVRRQGKNLQRHKQCGYEGGESHQ